MDDIRDKLNVICSGDGDRTRGIFSRALPPTEVEEAVAVTLRHVRALPDALAFVRQRSLEVGHSNLAGVLSSYLTEPTDLQPETLYGAYGYLDDAYLVVGAAMCLEGDGRVNSAWGSLDADDTQRLRCSQPRVRGLLHPDVIAFQDAMLVTFRSLAEEALRQRGRQPALPAGGAPAPALAAPRPGVPPAPWAADDARWYNRFRLAIPGVYASLR